MRHARGNKKLGRPTDQRLALLKSLVKALFENEKIKTTDTRAKEAKKIAERLISLAKKGDLHSRRLALRVLPHKDVVQKLFSTIAPRYEKRAGGYTRIIKLGARRGDAAPISLLELVE